MAELNKEYPTFTQVNGIWLPPTRAALELDHGNAAQSVIELEGASRYEAAGEFWPQYVRGLANLKLSKGAEAAVEFQKILDHRGYAPMSPLFPGATGLARAARCRTTPQKLARHTKTFALWKD